MDITTQEELIHIRNAYKHALQSRIYALNYVHIAHIPREVFVLDISANLVELNIFRSKIKSIPAEIAQLISLKKLTISHGVLKEIPPEIRNLTKLKLLNLSYNKITTLPDVFSSLTRLRGVNLSYNIIQEIPVSIQYIIINYVQNNHWFFLSLT